MEMDRERQSLVKATDAADTSSSDKEMTDLAEEARLLFNIAIPTVAVQVSCFLLFPQTASSIGRNLGSEELAGFSLASLTGNMTCLSIIIGALSATETLMPRAFGIGRYAEVGRLAIRGFAVSTFILIPPIIPLFLSMDSILDSFGQDRLASQLASEWIRVYLLGVPSVLLFRVVQRFLAAQNIVMPLVFGGMIGCFLVHPVFLRWLVPAGGFLGSGLAVVLTQTVQVLLVFIYLRVRKVYHPQTWPGLTYHYVQEAISPKPMLRFMKLSLGGVLSLSEWWFWETICFIAGRFGIVPLCVHTIAYQLIPVLFMVPLGMSIGMSVRMGSILSKDVRKAKRIAAWCVVFTSVLGGLIAMLVHFLRGWIVNLFTSDPEVIEGCERIWHFVCFHIFLIFVYGINSGVLRALGLQWRMAATIICVLWCTTLPVIIHVCINRGGGLVALWAIVPIAYTVLNVALILCYACADWEAIGDSARDRVRRSIVDGKASDERTYLLIEETRESISVDALSLP